MFTKWYKCIQRDKMTYSSTSNFKSYNDTTFTHYGNNTSGNTNYELALQYALRTAETPDRFDTNGAPLVSFGSGRTEPTQEDYKLEQWLENITYAEGSIVKTLGDNQDIFSNTFMITNNGTETISVSEVGIFVPAVSGSGNTKTTHYTMLERTVFEPVYIAPGDSATIKYEIVVNYPTV